MDSRRFNSLIVFMVRETGWTLEYIRSLPLSELTTLSHEMGYQHERELYKLGSYSAFPALMMAKRGTRLTDLIGDPPRKEGMQMPEINLAGKPQVQKITLNDGKEYELAPMNINILSDIEDKFDKPFFELVKLGRMKFIRYCLFVRLKQKYPDMTEEKVGELVDYSILQDAAKVV